MIVEIFLVLRALHIVVALPLLSARHDEQLILSVNSHYPTAKTDLLANHVQESPVLQTVILEWSRITKAVDSLQIRGQRGVSCVSYHIPNLVRSLQQANTICSKFGHDHKLH